MRKKNKNNNENAQMQDMNTVQMDGANVAFAANANFSGAILQDAEAMETLTAESGKKSKKVKKALAKKEKAKKKKEEYIEKKGLLGNADDYHVYHMKPVDTLSGYLMGVAAVAAGAYTIVEATFIFPIVFFCMFFLIYIGMYILQSVLIYTQTQKVASIVSKSMAVTGYEKVGKHTADNVNFDFKDNKYFTQDSVNTIYNEKAKLYRYFYTDPIAGNSDIESINSSLTSLIDNLSIISGGGVTCDINAKNYFINQTVSVTIKREGAIPEVFSYIGMDGVSSDITVTATAASCDGAEFVRNTDMVYDFVTFLSDRLHISDKISYLKEKVQGAFEKDAKKAANAAG